MYDLKNVKVMSKLVTAQYSWINSAIFEMIATKDTEVIVQFLCLTVKYHVEFTE